MIEDETHGAGQYLDKGTAMKEGLVSASGGSAKMRVGGVGENLKRKTVNIHTKFAWTPSRSFLAVMKYKHLPFGPGVWPGFWTMNSDVLWPAGGELDIMEYANGDVNRVTFHTNKGCSLDGGKLHTFVQGPAASTLCQTDYFQNKFGCKPPQKQRSGAYYANRPGVIAAEWTPSHIKVFHIPEEELPADIGDTPSPDAWDRWLLAYLPFNPHGCEDVAGPQELVLSLGLCGDWAGGAWEDSAEAKSTGFNKASGGCHVDIWDPANDCCTKFATSPKANFGNAYFDINWVKVFTKEGADTPRRTSATYSRGGVPLRG